MIEFKGYLTGNAEKRFFKRSVEFAQAQCFAGMLFSLLTAVPVLAMIMRPRFTPERVFYLFVVLGATILLFMLLVRIPPNAKSKRARTPNLVYVQDDLIICAANKYQECRKVRDVKKVRDRGEFYEIVFFLDRYSEKFICQKDLLTKGTLEEFEHLFEGKIDREC